MPDKPPADLKSASLPDHNEEVVADSQTNIQSPTLATAESSADEYVKETPETGHDQQPESPAESSEIVSGDENGQVAIYESDDGKNLDALLQLPDNFLFTGDIPPFLQGNEIERDMQRIVSFRGHELAELADNSGEAAERDIDCTEEIIEGKIAKGDTISTILGTAANGNVEHYIRAASKVFSMSSFREGQPYRVVTEADSGRVIRFEYEVNANKRLIVEGDLNPRARLADIEYVTLLDTADGVIDDSLFQAVADIGENPQLALRLVDLFGSEINFLRQIDEGDSFSVLLEKRYRDGEYKGYGRILAARFVNRGKVYEAFLFRDSDGRPAYFNAKGENLHKTLLQAPLAFTRLTSRFTHNRRHPILGKNRPHLGVDYGAPTGTPVKAVGDGTVTARGWFGGYGNQVTIKHGAGLESMYSHLSGFGRGLRVGQKVRQGQVIGFVGSTGLSTGPHLDFRLRQNGKFIDPVKAINPRGAPVAAARRDEFKRIRDIELACLNGDRVFENYTVDSIVPLAVSLPGEPKSVQKPRAKATRQSAKKKAATHKIKKTSGKKAVKAKSSPRARKKAAKKRR